MGEDDADRGRSWGLSGVAASVGAVVRLPRTLLEGVRDLPSVVGRLLDELTAAGAELRLSRDALAGLAEGLQQVDNRLAQTGDRLDAVLGRVATLDARLRKLEARIEQLDDQLGKLRRALLRSSVKRQAEG